ncbi:sulfatase [Acidobacteriota bacterium]
MFILVDALRAANLPMHGYPRNTAPNLSRISDENLLFTFHLANASYTRLSISQIFTGRLTAPMLMGRQHSREFEREFGENLLILPKVFKEAGYTTIIISSHPWYNHSARIMDFFDRQIIIDPPKGSKRPYALFEEMAGDIRGTLTELAAASEPFFIFIHTMDTHAPYAFHEGFDKYREDEKWPPKYNVYDSEIQYTDYWINEILTELNGFGLDRSTIAVVTSDHGEEFNEMGSGWWNRSHGPILRRAMTHVPLIMQLPEGWSIKGNYEGLSQHIDLAPTLVKLAIEGIDLSPYDVDGKDLSPELAQGVLRPDTNRLAYARNHRFWSLVESKTPEVEALLDAWDDSVAIYRVSPDRFNYPRPALVEDATNYASMATHLRSNATRRLQEVAGFPKPIKEGISRSIGIGIEFVAASSQSAPTYGDDAHDNRWHFRPTRLLSCGPSEQPGAITVAQGVPSGDYRLWVRLHKKAVKAGFKNGFTLIIGPSRIIVPEGGDSRGYLLDIGVHSLNERLAVTIEKPQGGVAIEGFKLEPEGGETLEEEHVDQDLTERLRTLGYVE